MNKIKISAISQQKLSSKEASFPSIKRMSHIVRAVFISLCLAVVASVFMVPAPATAATDSEACVGSGGSWVYNGSTLGCKCPTAKTLAGNVCLDQTAASTKFCTDSGGSWVYVGSSLGCKCPSSKTLQGNTCVDPVETRRQYCVNSGGSWEYNGTELSCKCPSGETLQQDICSVPPVTSTSDSGTGLQPFNPGGTEGKFQCGKGEGNEVKVSFDFGCIGGDNTKFTGENLSPIVDIAFAIFRFLSAGVGLVVIGSIIVAGIQYSASRGDPQATTASIKRISNSLIALLIYIFMFAIANFLVPGGMFI